jgi:serine/threonine protein kinase
MSAIPKIQDWDEERFKFERILQAAARNFGQVLLTRDTSIEGGFAHIAVKKMPNTWMQDSSLKFSSAHPESSERPWQDVGSVCHLNSLGYPYACRLLGIYRNSEFTYVATDLCAGGDLFAWCEQDLPTGEQRLRTIFPVAVQVLSAVSWLHDLGIMHKDISMENILLTEAQGSYLQVKLIDFGMSSTKRLSKNLVRGKSSYQAPEMHTPEINDAFVTDSFAVGVTLFSVAAKEYPWRATKSGKCKLFDYVRQHGLRRFAMGRGLLGGVFNEDFFEMVQALLQIDPKKRATLGEEAWSGDATHRSVWNFKWIEGYECAVKPGMLCNGAINASTMRRHNSALRCSSFL